MGYVTVVVCTLHLKERAATRSYFAKTTFKKNKRNGSNKHTNYKTEVKIQKHKTKIEDYN